MGFKIWSSDEKYDPTKGLAVIFRRSDGTIQFSTMEGRTLVVGQTDYDRRDIFPANLVPELSDHLGRKFVHLLGHMYDLRVSDERIDNELIRFWLRPFT